MSVDYGWKQKNAAQLRNCVSRCVFVSELILELL